MNKLRNMAARGTTVAATCACLIYAARLSYAETAPAATDATIAAERAEAHRIALIEQVSPAVVCIYDKHLRGGGSGVIIDDTGYGLTNFHVVAELDDGKGVAGLPDGKQYELEVLGIDPGGDVAMFRLHGADHFPSVELGDSDQVRVGDTVLAMGNPFLLSDDYKPTVTMGIVSGVNRYQFGQGDALLYSDCIQVDASINPGNSGGPLFDMAGRVIGINGRISISGARRQRLNVGLGFAITANQIKPFMPGLRAGLLMHHGTLQAVARDRPDGAAVFVELFEDGPAAKAGIRPGDKLLALDGHPVRSANEYASILGTLPADWPVPITFARPDGTVLHRIATTEPIEVAHMGDFEPSPTLNAAAVERAVKRFRTAIGPNTADPLGWRTQVFGASPDDTRDTTHWNVTFDDDNESSSEALPFSRPLPTDMAMADDALTLLARLLAGTNDATVLPALTHAGADRLLDVDSNGAIVESRILESIRTDLGEHAWAQFGFDADTGLLRRIRASDRPTGDEVTITFDTAAQWGDIVHVHSATRAFTIQRNNAPPAEPRDAQTAEAPDKTAVEATADYVAQRVVKLFGAKIGRTTGFGSGIMVSPNGLVLTVESALLESNRLRAHLADGREVPAEVVDRDYDRQLALIRLLGVEKQPFFDLTADDQVTPGQFVLAAGNPFKVATGREEASVALAVYAGRTRLDATRGTQEYSYHDDVLVLDAITSTPGFSGGAVADLRGRLVGMVGRIVESRATHTVLNYAVPADILADFVNRATGKAPATAEPEKPAEIYHGIKFFELSYLANPVFVERVRRGSPAARAGVRKDDLIIGIGGVQVSKLEDLERELKRYRPGDIMSLTIMRDDKVITVDIKLEAKQ